MWQILLIGYGIGAGIVFLYLNSLIALAKYRHRFELEPRYLAPAMWGALNADLKNKHADVEDTVILSAICIVFWGVHLAGFLFVRIMNILNGNALKFLALSKAERVQIALGVPSKSKESEQK